MEKTPKLIEGFKLHIPTDALAKMLKARATYHNGRAAEKEKELPELERVIERTKPGKSQERSAKFSNSYAVESADPVKALKTDIRTHKIKALRFEFAAKYLAPDSIYELEQRVAQDLELIDDEDDEDED